MKKAIVKLQNKNDAWVIGIPKSMVAAIPPGVDKMEVRQYDGEQWAGKLVYTPILKEDVEK